MKFEVMLQSLVNRGEVTGPSAAIPIQGAVFDSENCRWMVDMLSLEDLRARSGTSTVALRFESIESNDPNLLIVEDDLDG